MTPGFRHEAQAVALIIAAGGVAEEAEQSLRLAGFGVRALAPPERAETALAEAPALVVARLEGMDGTALDALLPTLAALSTDLGLVVSFGADQIDAVAGPLIGGPAQLLVDPDLPALTAAIVLAGAASGARVREASGEAERLRRISEEVARIAATLADIADRDRAPDQAVADRVTGFGAAPIEGAGDQPSAAAVRRVIRARRVRARFVPQELIEDPGWDMLLDLYAAERERRRVSISSLCIAASVPATTALRWISRLTASGLFERRPDPVDRRRIFIALSPSGRAAMTGCFAALAEGDLPIV